MIVTSIGRGAPCRVLALLVGATSLPAAAFQPLVTDDTGTQGKAGNQVELSYDRDRARQAGETTQTHALPLTFTRGLTDELDVFVGVAGVRIRSSVPGVEASGAGNPGIGAKWRFLESERSGTSLALKPEIFLPVSGSREARGLGSGRVSGALTLVLTREFAFGAVHANLGIGRERFRDPDAAHATTTGFSIAPVWNVAPRWQLALDFGYESEKAGGETTRSRFAEIGAVYSPGEDLDLAFGVVRRANSADPRETATSATMGLTWRFR